MQIFIDESGDPHPLAGSNCFAVGALVVEDDRQLEELLNRVASAFGDSSFPFHATEDSRDYRDALWTAINESELVFHFKGVAFDISQMSVETTNQSARLIHLRAIGHVLSLLPFCDSDTEVVISERAQSFTHANVNELWQAVQQSHWETLLSIPELRHTTFSTPPMSVVTGTPHRGLQLCDHVLWRWQRSIRNPVERISWPIRTLTLWQRPLPQLRHFQTINFMRGGSPLYDGLAAYSQSRTTLPQLTGVPLRDAYGCLAYVNNHDNGLLDFDHALIRLLLNSEDSEVYADQSVAHICYAILEGRTRWPYRFPMTEEQFGLYSALASYHIAEGGLDFTSELRSFDAMRFQIRDLRRLVHATRMRLQGD